MVREIENLAARFKYEGFEDISKELDSVRDKAVARGAPETFPSENPLINPDRNTVLRALNVPESSPDTLQPSFAEHYNAVLGRFLPDETELYDLIPQNIPFNRSAEEVNVPINIRTQYTRTLRLMFRNGYSTVGDVRRINLHDLNSLRRIGKKTTHLITTIFSNS